MKIELEDIFSTESAVEYINQKLSEVGKVISVPTFKHHVWVSGEIIPVEVAVRGNQRARGSIFLRSQLDEYASRMSLFKGKHSDFRTEYPIAPKQEEVGQIMTVPEVRDSLGISQQSMAYFLKSNRQLYPTKKVGNLLVILRPVAEKVIESYKTKSRG